MIYNEPSKKLSNENKYDNLVISDKTEQLMKQECPISDTSDTASIPNNDSSAHDPKHERRPELEEKENTQQHKFQDEDIDNQTLPKNKLEPFLQAFEDLKREPKVDSALEDADKKKDTVDGRNLKQLLVAKGVFTDVGEAHSFIQQMVLSNQLEEVGFETYKRAKDSKNA